MGKKLEFLGHPHFKSVTIERRKYKSGFRSVAVNDETGKVISHRKWSRKLNLNYARGYFYGHETLNSNETVTYFKNIREIRYKQKEHQVKVDKDGNVKELSDRRLKTSGQFYTASVSVQGRRIFSNGKSRQEARDNLANSVSKVVLGETDTDEGYRYLIGENVSYSRVNYASV